MSDHPRVISLNDARQERDRAEHLTCPKCGGCWWQTSVVIDAGSMSVTGYDANLTCSECEDGAG